MNPWLQVLDVHDCTQLNMPHFPSYNWCRNVLSILLTITASVWIFILGGSKVEITVHVAWFLIICKLDNFCM